MSPLRQRSVSLVLATSALVGCAQTRTLDGLPACVRAAPVVSADEVRATYAGLDSVHLASSASAAALVGAYRMQEDISPQTLRLDSTGRAVVSSRSDTAIPFLRFGVGERIGTWETVPDIGQIALRLPTDREGRGSCERTELYDVVEVAGTVWLVPPRLRPAVPEHVSWQQEGRHGLPSVRDVARSLPVFVRLDA